MVQHVKTIKSLKKPKPVKKNKSGGGNSVTTPLEKVVVDKPIKQRSPDPRLSPPNRNSAAPVVPSGTNTSSPQRKITYNPNLSPKGKSARVFPN